MLVLGIETSTPQTTVALGTERGIVAATLISGHQANHEVVMPNVTHLLRWSGRDVSQVGGIVVGLGPGLFTGMRVGIATAKTLAQVLHVPIAGVASLDAVAFALRYSRRRICATIDAKRRELFYAFYRPVPGGVQRETEFLVGSPGALVAELVAAPEDTMVAGNGTIAYGRELQEAGSHVELAAPAYAFPAATSLVELAIPRFQREDFDRIYDLRPYYVRRSDAEIAWDRARRAG